MYPFKQTTMVLSDFEDDDYSRRVKKLICSPMLAECIDRFNRMYADEETCVSLVHKLRWPGGFLCPHCEHNATYTIATRRLPLFQCRNCGHQTSLTAGTVMHKSRTSLRKWLLTMYIVATCDESINAVHLAALLSVTYKTAWAMLSKIRRVISEADRKTLLSGPVELKLELYMRQWLAFDDQPWQEKSVMIASTFPTDQISYYKIKHLNRTCPARTYLTPQEVDQFAEKHADSGLTYLEVHRRYLAPYKSQATLPRVAARAFRWLDQTFHSLGADSFQSYLDEFCFRMNNPADGDRCPFQYLLQLGLNAVRIDEPTDFYSAKLPCKIIAA